MKRHIDIVLGANAWDTKILIDGAEQDSVSAIAVSGEAGSYSLARCEITYLAEKITIRGPADVRRAVAGGDFIDDRDPDAAAEGGPNDGTQIELAAKGQGGVSRDETEPAQTAREDAEEIRGDRRE